MSSDGGVGYEAGPKPSGGVPPVPEGLRKPRRKEQTISEDDEELRLIAEMRMSMDSGRRYSIDEVAHKLGVDLDDE